MYNHFSALHGAQTELWHCKWARFRFRSAPTQTQTHTQTKFRRQSSSFCSCQSRKALNILFCFHQSFKQLLHRGAPPLGSASSRRLNRLIRAAHLLHPTGGVLTSARLQPRVPSHKMLQQPHGHPHYPGSPADKERRPTVSIVAAAVCLQLLSRPDEAARHHKCFSARKASASVFPAFLWICQTGLTWGRVERRVSVSQSLLISVWVVFERRGFVVSRWGSSDSCLLHRAHGLQSDWFLIKERGPSRLGLRRRPLQRCRFNYLLWERSGHTAGSLGLSAGTSCNLQ